VLFKRLHIGVARLRYTVESEPRHSDLKPDSSSKAMMRNPIKKYLIVETLPAGGVQIHEMKKWCRQFPERVPAGLDASTQGDNSQKLRRGFERAGWTVLENESEVRIMLAESAAAVDDIFGDNGQDSDHIEEESEIRETAFELERQLQEFIAHNLGSIQIAGKHLKLYSDDTSGGLEYRTPVGRIDILAIDESGGFVVLELKRGSAPDAAIGQLARYVGWVTKHLAKGQPVHGVIVARSIDEKLRYAIVARKDISLFEYKMKFELKQIEEADGL
jgi:endonuclease